MFRGSRGGTHRLQFGTLDARNKSGHDTFVFRSRGTPQDEQQDELNLAYLPPHARAYYANADERIQNALAHVNPARAVSFLRKTHGAQAGQEALMRALMAERQHHRTAARYWLDVYEKMMSG